MTTYDTSRYRGYDIVPRPEWSKWCVTVYPTRPDLPLLSHSTLRTLSVGREEALAAARRAIDRTLDAAGRMARLGKPAERPVVWMCAGI